MKHHRLWLFAGAVLLALSLVATSAAGPAQKPRSGGTVVFGFDQEPNALNPFTEDHFWAGMINSQVIVGSHVLTPRFTYERFLIAKPVLVQRNPFRLTYTIKRNAVWYENGSRTTRPVTADDYIFTWRTVMNKEWEIISTVGYEDITSARKINAKTVRFTFKKPFAGWKTIFNSILPRYALQGENFNDVWDNNLNNPKTKRPISNGPMFLERWDRGQQAVLRRNPRFKATRTAYLTRVVARFVPDTNTQAQQIRGGELDVIYPQPQAFLVPLRRERRLNVQVGLGPVWEHIDFNMGYRGKGDPALRKRFVREAIIRGINRQALVAALYHKTGIAPRLPVLNSGIIMGNQAGYRPHWRQYNFTTAARARQVLERNGCTRGEGGIYSCQGQRLKIRLSTTGGNALRVLAEQIMQEQLRAVGIDIDIVNDPGRLLFDRRLPDGEYDMAMYAWVGSPDITGWDNIYGCRNDATNEAQQNRQGYCNRTVDRLLKQVNSTVNEAQQKVLTNRALAQMARDIVIIPLFQKPTYLVHKKAFRGLKENPTSIGPVWNIEYWWKATA